MALSSSFILVGVIALFKRAKVALIIVGLLLTLSVSYLWWRDVTREARQYGYHTCGVVSGLKAGMLLFIFSEIIFFFGFFWRFINNRLNPDITVGILWPPYAVLALNPVEVPLLNTIILLSSGGRVTLAHHLVLKNGEALPSLALTVLLGVYFTSLQALEYTGCGYSLAESCFGRRFFVATGFHGFHVIVGTAFLRVCLLRASKAQTSIKHHVGLEISIWYWHFVDIVWLFLFLLVYCWGQ